MRILTGALLSLVSVGAILLIFSTTDKRVAVLQLSRDVPAGGVVDRSMLRTVEISIDPTLEVVSVSDVHLVEGQYARSRLLAGSLIQRTALQSEPLVAPGSAVVAVVVPAGAIPVGLQERSRVAVVFPVEQGASTPPPVPIPGRVAGLPGTVDPVTGEVSISLEVDPEAAAVVAAAAQVRLVLLDPGTDPADGNSSGGGR